MRPLANLALKEYYYNMELEYTYWQNGAFFVGFLNAYPDDSTQGLTLAELEEALVEVFEIRQEEKNHLAAIRKTGKLKVPA
ncbi:hypothetical protein FACS189473_4800 [Spirochaetia bacterium]|nr:hypothetical protein FACS189473_4800 [Spirochaetia bacterium]